MHILRAPDYSGALSFSGISGYEQMPGKGYLFIPSFLNLSYIFMMFYDPDFFTIHN